MLQRINIIADYREKSSGIPDLLLKKGADIELRELKSGDYFINRKIMVERKTKEDFVQSLVSNRLFTQCQRMKKNNEYPLLIIEGNPYGTTHRINQRAIKGAILSVSVAWQIPVFLTINKEETADIIVMAGKQMLQENAPVLRTGYKPKKLRGRKLFFIQGLPAVGPVLAIRLLDRFKSIERIINVSQDELIEIEGFGEKKTKQIIDFIRN
jgi:DNA excision repair protein ERCC-4